jgi:hypothetical protein
MRRLTRNRAGALLVTATVVVGLAAGAFAYWMSTGSGEATTQLGSPEQLTLQAQGSSQDQLIPRDTSSVTIRATNPNPYFVTLTYLALDTSQGTGGFGVDAGHSGCDLSFVHFVPQDPPVGIFGPGWRVPPKVDTTDGTLSIELADALSMDAGAPNACQGADFTIHVAAGTR